MIKSGVDTKITYVMLFTIVFFFVLAIGFMVSRLITKPIDSLVHTTKVIADGDLDERTNIQSNDEIGILASTFDEMTSRLQQRTLELEQTNEMLRNIDRTKTNFIQISAHELRTPLTLIMGYSQMLDIVISNEVGLGIVPDNALSREFRDIAGCANQNIAGEADEVYFVVAGIAQRIK